MKISWIILTWNSKKYIRKCIDSIMALSNIENEVIITDNGSTDGTVEYIKQLYNDKVQLNVLPVNNGTTISRNIGIKQVDVDADYVCILDSDTEVNTEAILYLSEILSKEPNALMAGPRLITADGIEQPSARDFPTLTSKIFKACPIKNIEELGRKLERCKNEKTDKYFKAGVIMSACWLIKPEAFKEIGLLDEYYFYSPEDTEYCLRIHTKGRDVLYCPEVSIIHEWQRISKKKIISKFNWESLKGHIHMFKQYHYCLSTRNLYRETNS